MSYVVTNIHISGYMCIRVSTSVWEWTRWADNWNREQQIEKTHQKKEKLRAFLC